MFSHAANGFGEFPGAWLPERFLVDTRAGNAGPSAGPVGNAPSRADAPFAVPSQVPKKPTQPLFPDDRSASGSSDNDSAERHGGHHKSGPGGKHGGRRDNRRVEPPASDDRGSCLDTLQLAPPGAHGPSGPRKAGEGVDPDETQRVVDAEWLACDDEGCQGARVRVTLLAAGFVIGASGASVRELSMKTNTTIQSWTEAPGGRDVRTRWHENHGHFSGKVANPTRVFRIKGTAESVSDAASIIREAVARYNELCEDKKKGEFVRRTQKVRDVEFSYQPPPKTASAGFNGGGPGFGVGKRHGSFNGSVRSQSGNKESYNLGAVGSASAPGFFPGNLSGFGDGNTMNSNQLRLLQQQLAQMAAASGFSHGFGGMSGMSGGMGGDFYHGNAQGNHAQGNHPQGNHAQGYHPQAAMFSLPVGTDPAVVAAAAQAAAHAVAAAAANRTGAGGQYAQPDTNMGGGMGAAGHRGDGFGVAPRTHRDRRGSSQHLPSNPSFDNLWASSAQWDPSAIGVHGQVTNAIPS